jgi:hypothetical protein
MDVGGWLLGLCLGRYEAAFRDNAIDADLLADITGWRFRKTRIAARRCKRLLKATRGPHGGARA